MSHQIYWCPHDKYFMDTKHCRTCDTTKPVTEFYTRTVNGNIYPASFCKLCRKAKKSEAVKSGKWKSSAQLPGASNAAILEKAHRLLPEKATRFILTDTRKSDKKRGRDNDLTREFIDAAIADGCRYCGGTELRMTLDRRDNALGHTQANVIPACYRCNITRGSMPYEAWEVLIPAMRSAYEQGLFGDWQSKPFARK
jgi:hypothetical protein